MDGYGVSKQTFEDSWRRKDPIGYSRCADWIELGCERTEWGIPIDRVIREAA
jgi:hypothetical protein